MKFEVTNFGDGAFCKMVAKDLVLYKNAFDYSRAIIDSDMCGEDDSDDDFFKYVDKDFCKSCFWPRDYFIYFGGEKYYITMEGDVSFETDEAIDAMFAYAKDSHTFDFFQDNVEVYVDDVKKELIINFDEPLDD